MIDFTDDFIARAIIAGCIIALIAAPLGCFILWRRMAYFGATIAHSGLLGAALGLALAINPTLSIILIAFTVAASLIWLENHTDLPSDALMGFLAHGALAAGLIMASLMEGQRLDLMGYLFGDIFSIADDELLWIIFGGAFICAIMYVIWRPLISLSVHEELAAAEGTNTELIKSVFIFVLAFTIAIAMKVIGILLITAFLIMPPSIARSFAQTPEAMLTWTAIISTLSVITGIAIAYAFNTPGGPTIIMVMVALLLATQLKSIRLR